ncbi:HdeD family acid-resistance protein [Lacticaseibacillus suihuaensis]
MFNRQAHFGFDWGEFITGIALIIAAVVMFRNPGATLLTLTFIFAIIAIIRGIATLAGFNKLREYTGKKSWLSLLAGVLDIGLGVVFLFNLVTAALTLSYLFAAWFLVDAIANLFNIGHLRQAGMGWLILDLLLDLFTVAVGVLLLMQPVVSAVGMVSLLAIAFVLFGLNAIITAFARRQL